MNDKDPQLLLKKAEAYFHNNRFEEMFAACLEAARAGSQRGMWNTACCLYKGIGCEKDAEEAVRWLKDCALSGHALSMKILGDLYFTGTDVQQDSQESIRWYEMAEEAGNTDAMRCLSSIYASGNGVKADLEKAFYYRKKAALAGDSKACYELGLMYGEGMGTIQNLHEALSWMEKAADKGIAEAMSWIGNHFLYSDDYGKIERSLHYFEKAAEMNNADGWMGLAEYYSKKGSGYADKIKKYYRKAFDTYMDDATSGKEGAMYNLGALYSRGIPEIHLGKDHVQAVRWWTKAAEKGSAWANNALGVACCLGLGTVIDRKKAVACFRKAVERHNVFAVYNLAECYRLGYGVDKDMDKAFQLYQQSAHRGFPGSFQRMGHAYFWGEGTAVNYREARYWFKWARTKGSWDACGYLAEIYLKGLNAKPDPGKAVELCKEGASNDDIKSQILLARIYIKGEVTEKNIPKAVSLLSGVCDFFNDFEEKCHAASVQVSTISMDVFDPFDSYHIAMYAEAQYLLASLLAKPDSPNYDPAYARRLLEMSIRQGFKGSEDEDPQKLLDSIPDAAAKTKAYVEIKRYSREKGFDKSRSGSQGLYDVILHFSDGTTSVVDFTTSHAKLIYVMALLNNKGRGIPRDYFLYGRQGACGKTLTKYQKYAEGLAEVLFQNESLEMVDYLGYKVAYVQGLRSASNNHYSDACSKARSAIKKACGGHPQEINTFKLDSEKTKEFSGSKSFNSVSPRLEFVVDEGLKDFVNGCPGPEGLSEIILLESYKS